MFLEKLFKREKLPRDIQLLYRGFIKKRIKLKNGWSAVILINHLACLYHNDGTRLVVGGIRKIFCSDDGKFMLIKKGGLKSIYDRNGQQLSKFSKKNNLYANGWYKIFEKDELSLFNTDGTRVGCRLKNADVFRNGGYFMSVWDIKDAESAGVYNKNGKKLIFTNCTNVEMFNNGWFISDNNLFDNSGNEYIGNSSSRMILNKWILRIIGTMMPANKVKA